MVRFLTVRTDRPNLTWVLPSEVAAQPGLPGPTDEPAKTRQTSSIFDGADPSADTASVPVIPEETDAQGRSAAQRVREHLTARGLEEAPLDGFPAGLLPFSDRTTLAVILVSTLDSSDPYDAVTMQRMREVRAEVVRWLRENCRINSIDLSFDVAVVENEATGLGMQRRANDSERRTAVFSEPSTLPL